MAPNLLLLEDATFSISRGSVHVEMSGASVSVPVNRLGDVIRALEGIRFIVDGTAPTGSTGTAATAAPTRATQSAPAAATAPSASVGLGAAVDAPSSLVDVPAPPRKKRRSRKRVGDALEVWMKKNPGWHSEQELLEVVIANEMTDAHPKRALKIALGKQADERFERDDSGNWRLLGDTAQGTAATSDATPARGRKPRATRAPAARTERGRRLKAKPAEAEAEADNEGEVDDDDPSARTVLVKRGQDRKSASMSPGELEARQAASEALDSRRGKRWPDLKQAELDRFKKNLFGLESTKKD